ncbi:hypothetical protein ACWDRR_00785 [Kitasatospora sp. NPDC003701]
MPHTFPCKYDGPGDKLDVTTHANGDVVLTVVNLPDGLASVYLDPADIDALVNAVKDAERQGRSLAESATPAAIPSREGLSGSIGSVDPAAVPFLNTMLPQPGTEGRERAFHRATELLGKDSSLESRLMMARFLMSGDAR